jgi:sugar/nucleoside kinase (ribokinase family)
MDYHRQYTGGMHTVAHNLALLGMDVTLITKLGTDDVGQQMQMDLDYLRVLTYSRPGHEQTPTEFIVTDGVHFQRLTNLTYQDYPHAIQDVPAYLLENGHTAIVNFVDSGLLRRLIQTSPIANWFSFHTIPDDDLLDKLSAVFLSYHDALKICAEDDFDRLAETLLAKGLPGLIIADRGMGCWLYTNDGQEYLPLAEPSEDVYYLGTAELLLSGLIFGLDQGLSYQAALKRALIMVQAKRVRPEIVLPQLLWPR